MKKLVVLLLMAAISFVIVANRQKSETTQKPHTMETLSFAESDSKDYENQSDGASVLKKLEELPVYEYETREILLQNKGQKIYGVAYIPKTGKEKVPLVISSHGLGGSWRSNAGYAEQMARHGIAVYCFDFRGGGGKDSEGRTTQMSVMTEVSDLETVLEAAKNWDFADAGKIILLGASQGGIVSAITAARHTQDVAGLILLYPAFMISDLIHEVYDSMSEVPKTFRLRQFLIGYPYVSDMWDYDVYGEIGNYRKKVLLLQGDQDVIVPMDYTKRASEVYCDADYYVIQGAGHGFGGSAFERADNYIFDYLQKIGAIS